MPEWWNGRRPAGDRGVQGGLLRTLVAESADVLLVVDADGRIRFVSDAADRVLGHLPAELVGRPLNDLLRPTDARRMRALLSEATEHAGSRHTIECEMYHRDGHWCETESMITSLAEGPVIGGLLLNIRDVSKRKRLEAELTRQANHDALTGLANRSLFRHRVEEALREQLHRPEPVAVLFLDLDGFKAVNDAEGHAVGDQLLGQVAGRLEHCVRPGDTVARLGGDEFAVLLEGSDAESAAVWVAERITSTLAEPFLLDGRELHVGVSTGIAVTENGAETSELLLRNADLAMYKAKLTKDANFVRFEPAMRDALTSRLAVEEDLRQALGRYELVLNYQPTVELATGRIVGVEALLRWYHPERGVVQPDEFISLAEDSGLIVAIGEWALTECAVQGARWQSWAPEGERFSVAVNLSARQLRPALLEAVGSALRDSGLPASALVLEMTESMLFERTDDVVDLMRALKGLGVKLAIDDFGTGYSSLSYLHRFPVDVLKIDRSFVESVAAETSAHAELVRTIVGLGQALRMATVAEGVETAEQATVLHSMGCDLGQGFLFSRPMPAAGIDELLALRGNTPHPVWPGLPRLHRVRAG
jgi:diguanylate cyclase (GGDEF)-like protein/PAS domain S-box-containing protein